MKVLMAMPFSPVPPDFGGALRVFHLVRQVARRHEVTVLTYGSPEDAGRIRAELQVKDVQVVKPLWKSTSRRLGQLYSTFSTHSFFQLSVVGAPFQAALDRVLSENDFDVVQTEFSHLGPFELKTKALKVLDTHNVEYDNFRRMWETSKWGVKKLHYLLEYRKMKGDELAWLRAQDAVLTTSERDKELFGKDVSVPLHVVPNGVDSAYFAPPAQQAVEPYSMVFTGMMAYTPNHDGIGWFLDEVMPRIVEKQPKARLYVVGKNPPPHITSRASERVVVTGTVPDVRPFVQRASVYVVPLRMGGGTRLKIAESLAARKPMVTTRVGCEGIDVKDQEHCLMADEPQAFADAVLGLWKDPARGEALASAGQALVTARYDWSVIGDMVERIYVEAKARRAA